MMMRCCGLAVVAGISSLPVNAASTLERLQADGLLRCGVIATPEDWNKTDLHGPLGPLDLEICKAISVSALGKDKAKVDARPYASELDAEEGLSKSEVDVLVGVTPDATAMWHWHIAFGPPVFYDGQSVLVRSDLPATAVPQLSGVRVCFVEGTDNEKVILARTVARGITINPMPFQEEGEMDDGLAVRHCDAISAHVSRLAQVRSTYPKQLGNDRILPDLLTLAPVAPAYRQGDVAWGMIVDWTIHALVQAEASGVTQANVAAQRGSEDVVIQRLLGIDWAASRALGLPKDWAAQMLEVVGNYGGHPSMQR